MSGAPLDSPLHSLYGFHAGPAVLASGLHPPPPGLMEQCLGPSNPSQLSPGPTLAQGNAPQPTSPQAKTSAQQGFGTNHSWWRRHDVTRQNVPVRLRRQHRSQQMGKGEAWRVPTQLLLHHPCAELLALLGTERPEAAESRCPSGGARAAARWTVPHKPAHTLGKKMNTCPGQQYHPISPSAPNTDVQLKQSSCSDIPQFPTDAGVCPRSEFTMGAAAPGPWPRALPGVGHLLSPALCHM